jgi:hypothetical protein
VNFFEDLFSGPNSPPIPLKLMHKRHPLYGEILGVDSGLIPTEGAAAGGMVMLAQSTGKQFGTGSGDPLLNPNTPQAEKEAIVRALEAELASLPANSKRAQ